MARRELGPAALRVSRAVSTCLPPGPFVVGCSGGADSLALALGAQWAARRADIDFRALVVDHGIQAGSAQIAAAVVSTLRERGVDAEVVAVQVDAAPEGLEGGARDARLSALAAPGLPVLLGHTLDDQAEQVFLGLLRGSGARSLAGMAHQRGPFVRPLLGLRRADTEAACRDWEIEAWDDPMNSDPTFSRVRARRLLALLGEEMGRDIAPALSRTATLLRADADLLDELTIAAMPEPTSLRVSAVADLPDALRGRVMHRFLATHGVDPTHARVAAVDALVMHWHGQGPLAMPGGQVSRREGVVRFESQEPTAPGPSLAK